MKIPEEFCRRNEERESRNGQETEGGGEVELTWKAAVARLIDSEVVRDSRAPYGIS